MAESRGQVVSTIASYQTSPAHRQTRLTAGRETVLAHDRIYLYTRSQACPCTSSIIHLNVPCCKKQALNECGVRNGAQRQESITAYTTVRLRNSGHILNNADQTLLTRLLKLTACRLEVVCPPVSRTLIRKMQKTSLR
jgi:hypothetical protein